MRNSNLFYQQLWKQHILCLLTHQNRERQHWKSLLQSFIWNTGLQRASLLPGKKLVCGLRLGFFLSRVTYIWLLVVCFGSKHLPINWSHLMPSLQRCIYNSAYVHYPVYHQVVNNIGNFRGCMRMHNLKTKGLCTQLAVSTGKYLYWEH